MTDRESELAKACDELAKAMRERDTFKSNDWNAMCLNGTTGVNLWLRDQRLMDGVLALCAELFDRKVAEARDTLETVGVEALKKERQP